MTLYSFNSVYYSGLDTTVFLNDTLLDEIVNIQFQLVENALPLYDYADYSFKTVVKGTRIVQGTFSINFTPEDAVLKALRPATAQKQTSPVPSTPTEAIFPSTVDIQSLLGMSNEQLTDTANKLRNEYWLLETPSLTEEDIEKLVSVNAPYFGTTPSILVIKYLNKSFDYDQIRPVDADDVTLKSDLNPADYSISQEKTTLTIVDVHITGAGQAIDDSGKNLLNVYNFVGKDLLLS